MHITTTFHPHRKGLFLPGWRCRAKAGSSSSPKALPLNSSLGIAIPIVGGCPRASGGSGEAGRGIGEGDLRLSGYKRRAPFILTRKGAGVTGTGSSTPREPLPLNSSLGIAIPILGSSSLASGGSGEARRGVGEENLKVRRQEKSPLYPHWEAALALAVNPESLLPHCRRRSFICHPSALSSKTDEWGRNRSRIPANARHGPEENCAPDSLARCCAKSAS